MHHSGKSSLRKTQYEKLYSQKKSIDTNEHINPATVGRAHNVVDIVRHAHERHFTDAAKNSELADQLTGEMAFCRAEMTFLRVYHSTPDEYNPQST